MTGHFAHQRSTGARRTPAADHRLDQFAAAVADARATNPAIAALAATEDQFIEAAMDIGAHLDRQTVGAAWLILGQLFGTQLATVPPEQQAGALAMLLNVAKLAGQRLYTGDRLPVEVRCPFSYGNDTECTKTLTAPNVERLDTLMRAHVWQNHPGREWPLVPDADGRSAMCVRCHTALALFRHAVYGDVCRGCYDSLFDELQTRTGKLLAEGDGAQG